MLVRDELVCTSLILSIQFGSPFRRTHVIDTIKDHTLEGGSGGFCYLERLFGSII